MIADEIYRKGNGKCLKGSEAKEFRDRVIRSEKGEEYDAVGLSERFREETNWLRRKVLRLKERYYYCFVTHKKVPKMEIT